MKNLKSILIVLLLAISAFSIYKLVMVANERHQLKEGLSRAKSEISTLEGQKTKLLTLAEKKAEENQQLEKINSLFKVNLRACNGKIFKINKELKIEQGKNRELTLKNNLVMAENESLKKTHDQLKTQYAQASKENEDYKAKFSNIAELKKAIRDLRKNQIAEQMQNLLAFIHGTPHKEQKLIEGNRGFLIKDGKPTLPAKVKVEVVPVSAN